MIDAFEMQRAQIEAAGMPAKMGLKAGGYAVVTIHRPVNVDIREALGPVEPCSPSPAACPSSSGASPYPQRWRPSACSSGSGAGVTLATPMGYVEFMSLVPTAA